MAAREVFFEFSLQIVSPKRIGIRKPHPTRVWMATEIEDIVSLVGSCLIMGGQSGHGFERVCMEVGQFLQTRRKQYTIPKDQSIFRGRVWLAPQEFQGAGAASRAERLAEILAVGRGGTCGY